MKENTLEHKLTREVRSTMNNSSGTGAAAPAAVGMSRFTYTVTSDDVNMTVKLVLKKRLNFSRRLLTKLKQGGGKVTRNGLEVRLFADVIEGDVIDVEMPEERCNFIPQDIPIDAVYEDDDMLVINKQPWVVVHPTMGHPVGTIANGLMKRMDDTGVHYKIRFVNRLDRDTSGLMIVAKNSHCQDVMTKLMKSDKVIKRYIAVVHGIIKEENKQQYLQTIYHKSIVLNELINAFSEYSKLEHPDFRPVKIKVDICEYAREYLAAKYNELVLGGCSLEVEIPEMIIWCQIDVQQMKRVFENLINNSVKHNKRGTALFFSMKKEADTVCISIGDNGTGIPKELAQMVFEPFVVGDESRNSRQGTGLGLAIAKKIVEAHGGVIELVKFPKEGLSTEFRIWMYTDEE